MKIIYPSTSEIFNPNPQKHIEEIARTCYKSNDFITEDSNKKFILNLYKNKHFAMLEHFIFIYRVADKSLFDRIAKSSRYIISSFDHANDGVISFSQRALMNADLDDNVKTTLIQRIIYDYGCYELFGGGGEECPYLAYHTWDFDPIRYDQLNKCTYDLQRLHGWHSIKFICDRGISHEIVRHRDASFAQESTRYANYSKDKFGNEITCIKPLFDKNIEENMNEWEKACENSEKAYLKLIESGCTPQEARSVLPNSLKTEVIMTARNYEWINFFKLRCDKAAHPQMRELTIPLFEKFSRRDPVIFSDIEFGPEK